MVDWVVDVVKAAGATDVKAIVSSHHAEVAAHLDMTAGYLSKLKTRAIYTYKVISEHEWDRCLKAAPRVRAVVP